MAFKDDILADLDDVFFNTAEFAEIHEINGNEIVCVVEGLTTNQAITKQAKNAVNFEGVSNETIVIHIKRSDLLEEITAENILNLDGYDYRVSDVTEDRGMVSIILEMDVM